MKATVRTLTAALPLVTFLLLPTVTRADTAVQAWARFYHGPQNLDDRACAVAVDHANDVIVTGYSSTSIVGTDCATIKYSGAGVPLWTNRYHPGVGHAVAVDGNNDVIVIGSSSSSGSADDYMTIKYSSTGVPLWTNRYNGPGNSFDDARAVAVDSGNNVIVTGSSMGSGSAFDYATIKYSSTGVPLWTNRYNGPGNGYDCASAVAVDIDDNLIVTGYSIGSGSGSDYATIKYSSTGAPLWISRYSGQGKGYNYACAVAVDGHNDVIVTGYSTNSGSGYDYATIKCSSVGTPLWTNCYNGPGNGDDRAYAVAVDGSNNVVVTGYSTGTGSYADYATIKYSSAGLPLWTNRYNGPGNSSDDAYAVAADGRNNVIVTGYSTGSGGGCDFATIKYSSAGVPLWTNRCKGPNGGMPPTPPCTMVADRSGNVILTGSSGDYPNVDYTTIKYVFPPVITEVNLAHGSLQMLVGNLQPGTLVIEASTNLAGWAPVFTNATPTNVLFYADPDAGNSPTRFYRAFQLP